MKASAIGAALVLALALTMPAEGRHSRRAVCVPIYEPGVGPGYFCASPVQRKHR